MKVCQPCSDGGQSHDSHTGTVPGSPAGADAGCPLLVDGVQCGCTVNLTPHLALAGTTRRPTLSVPIAVFADYGDERDPVELPITAVDLDGDALWVYVKVPTPD